MAIDITQTIFSSETGIMSFEKSGTYNIDFSGTFTHGTISRYLLESNIDTTRQMVFGFVTDDRTAAQPSFTVIPYTLQGTGTDSIPSSQDVFWDYYVYVDASGDLYLAVFKQSYGATGTITITTPKSTKFAYYVVDMNNGI